MVMVPAGRALQSTHAAILDDDVTTTAAGNDAFLSAAILDDDVTAVKQRALFISLPFCICDAMGTTADPVSAILDDGIITVKAQQLFPCSLNNILVDDVTATAGPRQIPKVLVLSSYLL